VEKLLELISGRVYASDNWNISVLRKIHLRGRAAARDAVALVKILKSPLATAAAVGVPREINNNYESYLGVEGGGGHGSRARKTE